MGKSLSMANGKKCSHKWKDSVWQFKVSRVELSNLLKTGKRKFVCTVMYVLFYVHNVCTVILLYCNFEC